MTDQAPPAPAKRADAALAIARLEEMSAQLRGCVILGPGGAPLAATGDLNVWAEAGSGLLEAADRAAPDGAATHVHVGTEDGEVFAVRHEGYALIAAADRFALASLLFFDIRSVLRDLAAAAPGGP